MLLEMKDEAEGNLNEEENDFMFDNHYRDDSLEELNASVIMMEVKAKNGLMNRFVRPCTDPIHLLIVEAVSISISDDDHIDSSIIFDDPYVDNNGGIDEHDLNAHD
uniref:Uncharacterized protein n=1 Tax=Tanacetum cinerariifolium TaxID=118510 RepID=A0A6L2KTQ0_TANCI|nr:hypothetical protein [Tanacetum cinerariifolium]GEU52818.1 hypothetical protein [Tanacetum cinerariifolium]